MKKLDHNQQARLADYVNGKSVKVSDEELRLMAENDDFASQIIEIAEVSKQAQARKEKEKGKTIRMIIMSVAACIVFAITMGVILEYSTDKNSNISESSTLASATSIDKGYYELPQEFIQFIETADVSGYRYDYQPGEPFDIILSKSYESDTLVLCNAQKQILLRTYVNSDVVPIEGLAEGLYYYYLIYNPKEKGALTVGTD